MYKATMLTLLLAACGSTEDTGSAPVDADGDGYGSVVDCDDTSSAVHPGADEVCDGLDNDCDDQEDEEPVDGTTFYADADGDGYGDAGTSTMLCASEVGWVEDATDCNDGDPAVNPGAEEVCEDGFDNDCDGIVGEEVIVEAFNTEPEIIQMLESYTTLSYNAAEKRLDWVTSTGVSPEPYATAIELPSAGTGALEFEMEVTTMGAGGNVNFTHFAWIDPATDWASSMYGAGSPSMGLGIALVNWWNGTTTSGDFRAEAAQESPSEGVTSYSTDHAVDTTFVASLTYDLATGDYSILLTETESGISRLDAAGTVKAGLSLSMLAVTGGFAEATAPVVVDEGWIDNVQVNGECL